MCMEWGSERRQGANRDSSWKMIGNFATWFMLAMASDRESDQNDAHLRGLAFESAYTYAALTLLTLPCHSG